MNKQEQVVTPMTRFAAALGYEPSEAQKAALVAYVQGYQLLLAGKAGTGKTSTFRALQKAGLMAWDVVVFNIQTWSLKSKDEILEALEDSKECEMVIDDVGRETVKNEYGEKFEVFDFVLGWREENCRGVRTHVVTNLTASEREARYGERVVSRLHLCKVIAFADEDKRRAVVIRREVDEVRVAKASDWAKCAEMCSLFREGRCLLGRTPPSWEKMNPGYACNLGLAIPFRKAFIETFPEPHRARDLKLYEEYFARHPEYAG